MILLFTWLLFLLWILYASFHHEDGAQDYWLNTLRAKLHDGLGRLTHRPGLTDVHVLVLLLTVLALGALLSAGQPLHFANSLIRATLPAEHGHFFLRMLLLAASLVLLIGKFAVLRAALLWRKRTAPTYGDNPLEVPLPFLNTALWPLSLGRKAKTPEGATAVAVGFLLCGSLLVMAAVHEPLSVQRFLLLMVGSALDALLLLCHLLIFCWLCALIGSRKGNQALVIASTRFSDGLTAIVLRNSIGFGFVNFSSGLAVLLLWLAHLVLRMLCGALLY